VVEYRRSEKVGPLRLSPRQPNLRIALGANPVPRALPIAVVEEA
jgi:hypothetical protein